VNPGQAAKEAAKAAEEDPHAPPPRAMRWGDSCRHYAETDLVGARDFVLHQLDGAVSSGIILTSTGKISRSKNAFVTVLEERGVAAAQDAQQREDREARWAHVHLPRWGGRPVHHRPRMWTMRIGIHG